MIHSEPGLKSWYPSSICGPYYTWFAELGYPNLDIIEHQDGSWSIIEYYNSPVIPSLTRWNYVLSDIRHVIPSPSFVEKYVAALDLRKKAIWDEYEAKEKAQTEEKAKLDQHAEATAEQAKNAIMANPDLMERVVKNGLQEINLGKLVKHIPRHQINGHRSPR